MFWKKREIKIEVPEIIEKYTIGDMEITRVKTSKPIKAAKPGIRIENF